MLNFVLILVAYIIVDAWTGIYHAATDHGYNIPSQLRDFRKHHVDPASLTFDLLPALLGVPVLIIGVYFVSPFLMALGAFTTMADIPHYYTHHPPNRVVKVLQWLRVIIPPEVHWRHHRDFRREYCLLSGWNNFWLTPLSRLVFNHPNE